MEVRLDKRYPVAASPEQAWAVLRDIRATAACMPGAAITEQLDDTHFKGTVKSKVGPAVMVFGGDIELLGVDEAAMQLKMLGKGADKSGSSASMNLVAHLEPGADAASAVLVGQATILVSGKLAQFGSRLLVPVSDAMLGQFANNFNAAAMAVAAQAAAASADAAAAAPAAPSAPSASSAEMAAGQDGAPRPHGSAGAGGDTGAPVAPSLAATAPPGAPASAATPAAAQAALATASSPAAAAEPALSPAPASAPASGPRRAPLPAPVPQATELNALALVWTVFKGWLAGLFGRKR